MSIRIRRSETERLELTEGDYLVVKKFLTAGEYRKMLRDSVKPVTMQPGAGNGAAAAGALVLDPLAAGLALVLAYLLDWSFLDADGRPLVIADQPASVVRAQLDAIDAAAYMEVQRAIQAHQSAMTGALESEKKILPGPPPSIPISTSAG
jgi:hypothetical protein